MASYPAIRFTINTTSNIVLAAAYLIIYSGILHLMHHRGLLILEQLLKINRALDVYLPHYTKEQFLDITVKVCPKLKEEISCIVGEKVWKQGSNFDVRPINIVLNFSAPKNCMIICFTPLLSGYT